MCNSPEAQTMEIPVWQLGITDDDAAGVLSCPRRMGIMPGS